MPQTITDKEAQERLVLLHERGEALNEEFAFVKREHEAGRMSSVEAIARHKQIAYEKRAGARMMRALLPDASEDQAEAR